MSRSNDTPEAASRSEIVCVQRLVSPDPAVNTEKALFYHSSGSAGYDTVRHAYFVMHGSKLSFDSYFNAFPAHLFNLQGRRLKIEIRGRGEIVAEVTLARHGRSWDSLVSTRLNLTEESTSIEIPAVPLDGVIYLSARGVTDAVITDIDYKIVGACDRPVAVTAVITTFKRDAAVQRTAKRLKEYLATNEDIRDIFSLIVVDNGGDTKSLPPGAGEVISSPNLGGAGGFTRGLKVAVERQWATHVLFMDDDANFFPESIRRTISLLRYTKEPNLAVSGAMITEAHKWRMWENAATFNQKCTPIHSGIDLRIAEEVIKISHAQPRHASNKYAGWWYFCFPIASVKVWPFPFFVRGDDSYFSLANNFEIVTMLGVVAHQEDFFTKQSPLTIYLDLRYHLVHHLTFDELRLSPNALIKMASRYFHRFNNSYHYESAAAINLAISDVLSGEEFWEKNADMAARRKTLQEISVQERVVPQISLDFTNLARHVPKRNTGWLARLARKWSFNGHIVPMSLFYTKGVLFPLSVRGIEHDTFLRRYSATVDVTTSSGYVCRINRKRYFENLKEFRRLTKALAKKYPELLINYKQSSVSLTSRESWERRFGRP